MFVGPSCGGGSAGDAGVAPTGAQQATHLQASCLRVPGIMTLRFALAIDGARLTTVTPGNSVAWSRFGSGSAGLDRERLEQHWLQQAPVSQRFDQ